ncbi:cytochrome c-type biogenesis protein CcmH [Candidatus Poriferisodalis sp.]|uniref:cytochrome c-type biogenesis protein CcmH n=1 Tax=Candidatus Poriferisodalis sp. TaxID=3101277 RepID=UPI003B59A5B5
MSLPEGTPPAATTRPQHRGPRMRRIGWLVVVAVAIIAAVVAATASRPPATEAERAYELKQATLCPVCDGQSVLESNAPAAAAMRRQIDLWVDAGRSDTEIRADLAAAYGDDVNALPPGEGVGTLVWALPVAAFAAAVAGLWAATRRWRARARADEPHRDGAGEASAPQYPPEEPRPRRFRFVSVVTVGALVLVGALAGVVVARSVGLRLSGETISGDIDRSARSLLVDAQRQFAANQLDASRATLEEIFRLDRDLRGALVLSARLHLRHCESLSAQDSSSSGETADALVAGCDLQSALVDLDRVLAEDSSDTEALALRGWLLVRIPDPELITAGIASLDAAVALNPGEFDPWVFRGYTARFVERDLPAAIRYYQSALQRNPPPAMAAALESAITEMQAELE